MTLWPRWLHVKLDVPRHGLRRFYQCQRRPLRPGESAPVLPTHALYATIIQNPQLKLLLLIFLNLLYATCFAKALIVT